MPSLAFQPYFWGQQAGPPPSNPYDPAYFTVQKTEAHGSYTSWVKYKDMMKVGIGIRRMIMGPQNV